MNRAERSRGLIFFSYLKRLITSNSREIILQFLIPFLIVFVLFWKFFSHSGYIFYGDVLPSVHLSLSSWINQQLFIWNNGPTTPTLFFDWLPFVLFIRLFGPQLGGKLFAVLLAALPGPAMFWATYTLLKIWYRESNNFILVGAFLSELFYLLSPTNTALFNAPTSTWAPSYIAIPILFALFVRFSYQRRVSDLVCFGVLASLSLAVPTWLLVIPIMVVLYSIADAVAVRGTLTDKVIIVLELSSVTILLSLYELCPILFGFINNIGGSYSFYAAGSFGGERLTYAALQSQSFSTLLDAIFLGHPTFYVFHYFNRDWNLFSIVFVLCSFGVLFLRRDHVTFSLSFGALAGIFLSKGANPPFGFLYYLIASNSPPGLSGLFYDTTPFMLLTALCYSMLLSIFVMDICKLVAERWQDWRVYSSKSENSITFVLIGKRARPSPLKGILVASLLTVVILVSVFSGSVVDLHSVLQYYGPQNVPESYFTVASYVDNGQGTYNVMWIPTSWSTTGVGGAVGVNWTNPPDSDTGGGFPTGFTTRYSVPPVIISYLPHTKMIGKYLSLLNVKYVIVHDDTYYNLKPILQELRSQLDLKQVMQIGNITVFENEETVSGAWQGTLTYLSQNTTVSDMLDFNLNPLSSLWYLSGENRQLNENALSFASSRIITNPTPSLSSSMLPTGYIESSVYLSPIKLPVSNYVSNNITRLNSIETIPVSYLDSYISLISNHSGLTPGNTTSLTFRYSLPNTVVNQNYSGSFNSGFSVMFKAMINSDPNLTFATIFPNNQTLVNATSGYFSINLSVPSKISGEISLFARFFGGSFGVISPYYFVAGLYPPSVGFLKMPGSTDTVIGATNTITPLRFFTPISGRYDLFVRGWGNLTLSDSNTSYSLNAAEPITASVGSIWFTGGDEKWILNSSTQAFLTAIYLQPTSWPHESLVPVNLTIHNPTSLSFKTTKGSHFIYITAPYSPQWSTPQRALPFANGLAYGFAINSSGYISIHFRGQSYLYFGQIVSASTLIVISVYSAASWRRKNREKKHISALQLKFSMSS